MLAHLSYIGGLIVGLILLAVAVGGSAFLLYILWGVLCKGEVVHGERE